MKLRSVFLLVFILGFVGYLVEPLLFSHLGKKPAENSKATPALVETREPVTVESHVEPAALPKNEPERLSKATEPPAKVPSVTESSVTEPSVTETAQQKEEVRPVKEVPAKKPAFPIASLKLDRYEKNSVTGSPNLEKAIQIAIKDSRFKELATLLAKDLYQPVQGNKEITAKELESLIDNPAWNHSLNVHALLQYFSADEIAEASSSSSDAEKFYYWLLTTPEALSQLLYNITPQDDFNKALSIWQNIWKSEQQPEMRIKYLNLAIACALVYDKGKIKPKTGYSIIEPLPRYTVFKKNAEAGRLKTTLSKLNVSDLVWVVDVPITDEEIEWAVSRANFSRRRWGKAYGHIDYLMERAVNNENPYSEYTFAQIEKHGGICGDQTYFSVNTAKANGIPAAGVTGSGDRGGHAWLAYKPNKDEWDTTTGRYENYSNGQSKNSQTNQSISEFDFILMSDRKMKESRVQEAQTLLRFVPILISMKHDSMGIRQTLEEAVDIAPLNQHAWADYVAFLEQATPSLTKAEWQKIIDTIERTFNKHPSMWMTARALTQKHIWKDLKSEEIAKTQARYRSEIARKFPARGDLIRKVIGEQGDMLRRQNDFKATRSFYRQSFRLFGEDTLNFKFISERYFKSGEQYPNDREQICDDIASYFRRSIDQESGDYFKAKTEINFLTTISSYYSQIGDERKANKYSDEAAKRKKKSSKRAL